MQKVTCVTRILTLSLCFGLITSLTIKDRLTEPHSNDLDARVVYLLNIIRQLKSYTARKDQERQFSNKVFNKGGGVDENNVSPGSQISLEKKDFGILPPSSEWCRMMGFRACRQHS